MAAPKEQEYNGFRKGDIAVRKGRLCTIMKIHWETNPPSVTVKMQDDGNEVGTEFNRLDKPSVCAIYIYYIINTRFKHSFKQYNMLF